MLYTNTYTETFDIGNIDTIVYIDRYPDNQDAEGTVVAQVIKTRHNDVIAVYLDNDERANPRVIQLIEHTKAMLESITK